MSEDLLEVGLTQEKPVRPKKSKQQTQDNQVDTSIVVPPAHLGFGHDGICLTCGLKKRTNLTGSIFCPIDFPECPRNN